MFGNAKVLALALGLAAVVVILYNVHVNAIRNEIKSGMIKLPCYNKDKNPGDAIKKTDIDWVEVPDIAGKGFSNVMRLDQVTDQFDRATPLARGVNARQWVQIDDFIASSNRDLPQIDKNSVVITVKLDANEMTGKMLAVGARVNLAGRFLTSKGSYDLLPIIDGVVVREVGSRSIRVEIPIKYDPEQKIKLSQQVSNALSHAQSQSAMLELRTSDRLSGDLVLREEVKKFAASAMPSITEGSAGPVPAIPASPY